MAALIIGIIIIAFGVYAVIPDVSWGLQWGRNVLEVLKGIVPLLAYLVGALALLIGFADIKDKLQTKKEKAESQEKPEQDSGE